MQPIRPRRVPTQQPAAEAAPAAHSRWVSVDQMLAAIEELQEAQQRDRTPPPAHRRRGRPLT